MLLKGWYAQHEMGIDPSLLSDEDREERRCIVLYHAGTLEGSRRHHDAINTLECCFNVPNEGEGGEECASE